MKNVKTIKKSVAIFLCAVMLACALPVVSFAKSDDSTLRFMSYNVSGIPVIGTFQGTQWIGGNRKSAAIGEMLNKYDCDFIGVQEDFNFHDALAQMMSAFPFQTIGSGIIPIGDGLNVFSKHPIFDVKRTEWEGTYGFLSGSADRITRKGYVKTVIEIADGVYIDLYVVHADAGRDILSIKARGDNYRQIVEDIMSREDDRAVIVMGDFNSTFARNTAEDIYNNLMKPAGLKDTWAELYNGGDYTYEDGINWNPLKNESIDRVLYKDGGGVEFAPKSLDYVTATNDKGKTYTDHNATIVEMTYKVVGKSSTVAEKLETETKKIVDPFEQFFTEAKAIVSKVGETLLHSYEIFYLIAQIWM